MENTLRIRVQNGMIAPLKGRINNRLMCTESEDLQSSHFVILHSDSLLVTCLRPPLLRDQSLNFIFVLQPVH